MDGNEQFPVAKDVERGALLAAIEKMVEGFTAEQRANIPRFFPQGFAALDDSALRNAYGLCVRTAKKNAAALSQVEG